MNDAKTIVERVANLLSVKSLVTLMLAVTFVVLAVWGELTGEQFMTIFSTVIAFYFGTQAKKEN